MLEGHCRRWHGLEGTVEERGSSSTDQEINWDSSKAVVLLYPPQKSV